MTFTSQQSRALGRGLKAAVERSNDRHSITLQFDWAGTLSPADLISLVKRKVASHTMQPVDVTQIRDNALAETREALEGSQALIEKLRARIRELEAQQEMQPPAAARRSTAISIKDWAESLGVSYSTAWRYKAAGRVKFINVGGGKKHDNVLVYPESFVPPIKGKKS